ncbi:MAG: segregation/condensation protein A [Magnetovibrio sp.]|nr:segregation/condensation protein A [Magnetovibrio sp.]
MNEISGTEVFKEGQAFELASETSEAAFTVDLEGFEGAIDVLLALARDHKLDITQMSMSALADQYLAFVSEARRSNLELAADYLVMAAWLAYMKSRLLLPDIGADDEPSGEELANALAFQLKRLQAMKEAGECLRKRSQLGTDFFWRGDPEIFRRTYNMVYDASLFDLLKAYGSLQYRKGSASALRIEPFEIYTVEDALVRLRRMVRVVPE